MKLICCVCKKVMNPCIHNTKKDDGLISHGYCVECAEIAKSKIKNRYKRIKYVATSNR